MNFFKQIIQRFFGRKDEPISRLIYEEGDKRWYLRKSLDRKTFDDLCANSSVCKDATKEQLDDLYDCACRLIKALNEN